MHRICIVPQEYLRCQERKTPTAEAVGSLVKRLFLAVVFLILYSIGKLADISKLNSRFVLHSKYITFSFPFYIKPLQKQKKQQLKRQKQQVRQKSKDPYSVSNHF